MFESNMEATSGASDAANLTPIAASIKYLYARGNVYYMKRKVPADVPHAFPNAKDTYWKSLRTSSRLEAIERLAPELKQFDLAVVNARLGKAANDVRPPKRHRGEGTTKYLLDEHIPALMARYEYMTLHLDDEERRVITREDRQQRRADIDEALEQLRDAAASDSYVAVEETAQLLLSGERLIAPPRSLVRERLLRELLRVDIKLLEIQRDRLLGNVIPTPDVVPISPRDLPTLKAIFEEWRRTQTVERTIATYELFVEEFEGKFDALPVQSITAAHVNQFRDHLATNQLSRGTIRNYLGGLATLVGFGQLNGGPLSGLLINPFERVSLSHLKATLPSEERRPFEEHELAVLFNSPLYTQGYRPTGQAAESAYWLPLMGPFVGGRIEELAQLRLDDIQCINGSWCLRLANLHAEQHLKTESSFRRVPLHEELLRCGFLAYVQEQRVMGHQRLFPSQRNRNKHRIWSNAVGKWFGRYLTSIGLDDPRLCFHSFRSTFKQQCSLSGIETEERDALTGHWVSRSDPGRGYMKDAERQYPYPALVSAIAKLRYDGLDLSRLHRGGA